MPAPPPGARANRPQHPAAATAAVPTSAAPQPPTPPLPNIPDAAKKMEYAKKHNIHHLFELLAHRVLDRRPDDVFQFLREQITEIEAVEKRRSTYDPTEVSHAPKSAAPPRAPSSAVAAAGAPASSGEPIKVTIGVFGLDNAGKTSLIAAIGKEVTKNATPTVGFTPTYLETPQHKVCIFDLGGGASFRGIWPHYFHDCHGIFYVVDTSDTKRLAESASVFKELVQHEYIRGKPIVVYCNKKDLAPEGAIATVTGPAGLDVANQVGRSTPTKIVASCAVVDTDDSGVDEGADWLLTTITERYATLSGLISEHTAAVKKAKAEKLAEQRRRVEEAKAAEAAAAGK